MTLTKVTMGATAMFTIMVTMALHVPEIKKAQSEPSRIDEAFADVGDTLAKADREELHPTPQPVYPKPAEVLVPVQDATPPPPTPIKVADATKPSKPRESNWCTRHGMHRVYYHKKWWCRKPVG